MLEVLFPDMFLDVEDLEMVDVVPSQEVEEPVNAKAGPSTRR